MDRETPPPSSSANPPAEAGLLRRLGLFDCTMIVMGTIIGAGVFNAPHSIAQAMGSPGAVLMLWVVGGAIALSGALVFAELGTLFPRAGGQYVFLREAFGRPAAFFFGWLLLAAINSGAIAYVANVFVDHLQALLRFGGAQVDWSAAQRRGIALAGIVALAAINVRGVRVGATFQNVAMLAKIAGILAIVGLGAAVAVGATEPSIAPSTATHAWSWSGMFASLLGVVFTYGGWQNVTAVAGEVREPARTIPRAILIGTLAVIGLYLAMNAALIAILGVEGIASTRTPAATAAGRVLSIGEPALAALVMLSTLAIAQALLFVTPRIYYAMAKDGAFFAAAGYLHPRWRTPVVAIGLQAAFGSLHLFLGQDLDLLQMTTIVDFAFFGLCGAALFVFRRRLPNAERAYRAVGYPWVPAAFTAACAVIVISALRAAEPVAVMRAGAMVLIGAAIYAWQARGARRA